MKNVVQLFAFLVTLLTVTTVFGQEISLSPGGTLRMYWPDKTPDFRRLFLMPSDISNGSYGYKFSWRNDDGSPRSSFLEFDNNGNTYFSSGNVGIGTTNPSQKLDVNGNIAMSNGTGRIEFKEDGATKAFLNWDGANITIENNETEGTGSIFLEAQNDLVLRTGSGDANRMFIDEIGRVGINTTSPSTRLDVNGSINANGSVNISNAGAFTSNRTTGESQDILNLDSNNDLIINRGSIVDGFSSNVLLGIGADKKFLVRNSSNNTTLFLIDEANGNVGVGTTSPASKLHVNGKLTVTGSDFAERFNINTPSNNILPGMVVSIDPDNEGELLLSQEAYDKKVAGIISGAGGVRTGMVMGEENTLADGDTPVALSGRVYCYVDASYGAVHAGDLLTSSPTIGHAMKVTDYENAKGAVIGKAMTSLKSGKGLVLVLVSLQ